MTDQDNETWLIYTGDAIISTKAAHGIDSLSLRDRLIYCLWVADYGMRNAGDLATAGDLYSSFHSEGLEAATQLQLPHATAAFSLSVPALEAKYFELFDDVCREHRAA